MADSKSGQSGEGDPDPQIKRNTFADPRERMGPIARGGSSRKQMPESSQSESPVTLAPNELADRDPDFDPITAARGASVNIEAILGFGWDSSTSYLSSNAGSVVRLAAAIAKEEAGAAQPEPVVRARHLLRAHILSTLLGEGGHFGIFVRSADEKNELFSRLIRAEDHEKIPALAAAAGSPPAGAVAHWELVEILARASEFRRATNKTYRDIGQRHLFAAAFATKEGQNAFRDIGALAQGFEHLRATVIDCLKIKEFARYGDDVAAWQRILAELAKEPPFYDPSERRPDYLNDQVRFGLRLGQEPLGAAADARALADLILLEAAEPPIAVGLFGPWGSGKSTLIEHLKTEVVNQTARERARRGTIAEKDDRLRIVANVVQLSFNAWTFADSTNLWATFTSEIFDQLAAGGSPMAADDDPAGQSVDLQTRVAAGALVSEVAARTAGEVASLRVADIAVQEQDRAIEVAEELLAKARSDRRVAFGEGVIDAAKELGKDAGQTGSVLELVRTAYWLGWKRTLAIALVLLAAAAAAYFLPSRPLLPPSAIEELTAAGVLLSSLWPAGRALFSAWHHWRMHKTAATQAVADARTELLRHRERRATAERDRDRSKAFLSSYAMDQHGSAATSPMQMLDYLLKESKSVAAVRAQTGLLAVVRRCFEQLEIVIANARRERADAIDRIILYIDDLDRCSTRQVSEILQAVHLLLSFNCFVVIVAADANWLKHSLEEQHPQLFNDQAGRLTPADYLEKIFQIPFWVRPLVDADAHEDKKYSPYHSYIDFLLKEEQPAVAAAAPTDGPESKSAGPKASGAGGSFAPRPPTRDEDPAAPRRERMILKPDEQQFLKTLGPLAAKSPRAVKRLINTYRLIRVRLDGPELDSFLGSGDEDAAAYRAVLFALACEVGLPPATMTKIGKTIMAMDKQAWSEFIARLDNPIDLPLPASPDPDQTAAGEVAADTESPPELLIRTLRSADRLQDFRHSLPAEVKRSLRQLKMGLDEVRRYSFRPL
ncbi:MAG TPA: P-loop NTPase fold protein [Allosphingosinicella sp.]|jgi:hypothetical protein